MEKKNQQELKKIAQRLIENGKGILAIDESPKSMEKKFQLVGIENTAENRQKYREVLLTCPKEIGQYLGGVILNEETFFQKDCSGAMFIEHMEKAGICVGVKLDKGLLPLNQDTEKQRGEAAIQEKISIGLEDLKERCKKYKKGGASFAKWRSVFSISQGLPTEECIDKNCGILSEYALVCQSNGLVPVVEPEVLFDGSYSASQCEIVTASIISCLFFHINKRGLFVPGIILKCGFVTSGPKRNMQSLYEVAEGTLRSFMNSVPPSVTGIVFLSGGHPENVSVDYLKEASIVKRACGAPWCISYSFGRALQDSVLKLWGNRDENKQKAQKLLIQQARTCSEALKG